MFKIHCGCCEKFSIKGQQQERLRNISIAAYIHIRIFEGFYRSQFLNIFCIFFLASSQDVIDGDDSNQSSCIRYWHRYSRMVFEALTTNLFIIGYK
jgi:hypothetical protein